MTYVLKQTTPRKHHKTGEPYLDVMYHVGFIIGCPEGSGKIERAKRFPSKAVAEVFARNKLAGRRYFPEKVDA